MKIDGAQLELPSAEIGFVRMEFKNSIGQAGYVLQVHWVGGNHAVYIFRCNFHSRRS